MIFEQTESREYQNQMTQKKIVVEDDSTMINIHQSYGNVEVQFQDKDFQIIVDFFPLDEEDKKLFSTYLFKINKNHKKSPKNFHKFENFINQECNISNCDILRKRKFIEQDYSIDSQLYHENRSIFDTEMNLYQNVLRKISEDSYELLMYHKQIPGTILKNQKKTKKNQINTKVKNNCYETFI